MVFRFIICPYGPGHNDHSRFSNAFWFESDVLQPLRALLRDARKNCARTQASKDELLGNFLRNALLLLLCSECFVGSVRVLVNLVCTQRGQEMSDCHLLGFWRLLWPRMTIMVMLKLNAVEVSWATPSILHKICLIQWWSPTCIRRASWWYRQESANYHARPSVIFCAPMRITEDAHDRQI